MVEQAPLRDSRSNAIGISRRLGGRIARCHPEIAETYRQEHGLSQLEIGERLYPDLAAKYPKLIGNAVGYALKLLVPREELRELSKRHVHERHNARIAAGVYRTPEFKKKAAETALKRSDDDPDVFSRMSKRSAEALGYVIWSVEEREYLFRIMKDPQFQFPNGQHRGQPSYALIAEELNRALHGGDEIRSYKSTKRFVQLWRYKQRRNGHS